MLLRQHLSNFGEPLKRVLQVLNDPTYYSNSDIRRPTDSGDVGVRRRIEQTNHRLQPSEVDELVGEYLEGASLEALARKYDIHSQTVIAHLERRGVELRRQTVLTDEQVAQIIEQYAAGRTLRQLAAEFDAAYGTVRNYLLRNGVTLRAARRLPRS